VRSSHHDVLMVTIKSMPLAAADAADAAAAAAAVRGYWRGMYIRRLSRVVESNEFYETERS